MKATWVYKREWITNKCVLCGEPATTEDVVYHPFDVEYEDSMGENYVIELCDNCSKVMKYYWDYIYKAIEGKKVK
jgi:hypothetical protein